MNEYHKIDSIFKRSEDGKIFLEGQYSRPEFKYLKDNEWEFTEKVDGTNIRVIYHGKTDIKYMDFKGKSDNSQTPQFLLDKLNQIFCKDHATTYANERMIETIKDEDVCLYGEGYGAKIQKSGGNYKSDGVDFILFDVKIGEFWLKSEDVAKIAYSIGIQPVPRIGYGTLDKAIKMCEEGFNSNWGNFIAEGIVLKPKIQLFNRMGSRVITKIKYKDFHRGTA